MKHAHGLVHDLGALTRRGMLRFLGGAALVPLVGSCTTSEQSSGPDASGSDANGTDATSNTCAVIPDETGGPYPGDGTNGVNALAMSGIVRSDLRSSFGTATGVADGIVLAVSLVVVDASAGCTPLADQAVYIWHCDAAGNYSLYSPATASENYLRGIQVTDANGRVTFTTIVPGCYAGRWPHIHLEVFSSLAAATTGRNAIKTSQIAIPQATCEATYATTGYPSSATNLSQVSLATDMVFADGATLETPTVTGSVTDGFAFELPIGV
jgi:protocatechuate 3,4-dioxygenase beta subunit